jgi:enoyl-CoA hydratase/carnithine racemase
METNMNEYETLRVEMNGAVMNVILSHPPINLMDDAMVADLGNLVTRLENDRETKVVIFRSDTPDYFIAHFDISLGEHRVLPPYGAKPLHGVLHTRISHLEQVTIGELRGRARGAGNEFFVSLDMRYGSIEKAVMGQPEIMVGLHPGAGGTARLTQLMGRSRAFEAALSGFDYDAITAERWGWINRALPDTMLSSFVDQLAQRIASFPATAIASVKSIVNQVSVLSSSVLNEDTMRLWREIELPDTQTRLAWMLKNGGQTAGPMEYDLGTNLARFPETI